MIMPNLMQYFVLPIAVGVVVVIASLVLPKYLAEKDLELSYELEGPLWAD